MQKTKKRRVTKSKTASYHGKQYAITDCPFCGASIYERHLTSHIDKFHSGMVLADEPLKATNQPVENSELYQPEINVNETVDKTEEVFLDANEMLLAITRLGMPCTLRVLESRLHNFFIDQIKPKKENIVKIHIAW